MKKEDIEFLRDLQHELNTQENDGNADPLYWGIMETTTVRVPEGEGTPYIVEDYDAVYTIEEYVKMVNEAYVPDMNETTLERWNDILADYEEYGYDVCLNDIVDFVNDANNGLGGYCDVSWAEEQEKLCQNTGAFLTKRAAKNYIEKFSYNHHNPHTYAMTAYRNFELDRLLKILKTMDIDQLKED